jgi:hypothetical protein
MANPDAPLGAAVRRPWGYSDLGNSVDDELVASAETVTETIPDSAGGQDDSGSARYYGRYGRSGGNKEERTYYYLGKRSTIEEPDAGYPYAGYANAGYPYAGYPYAGYANPYYGKRSADAKPGPDATIGTPRYYYA